VHSGSGLVGGEAAEEVDHILEHEEGNKDGRVVGDSLDVEGMGGEDLRWLRLLLLFLLLLVHCGAGVTERAKRGSLL